MRLWYFIALGAIALGGCATAKDSLAMKQKRLELQQARYGKVDSREVRDEHSRVLERVLEEGALDGESRDAIRDTLGQPDACTKPICQEQGFTRDDWYYEIGVNTAPDEIKQMPLLIVGFDLRGQVSRLYSLTTH